MLAEEGFETSDKDELLRQIKRVNIEKLEDFALNYEGHGEEQKEHGELI